jgi:hypothetical protein
MNIWEFFLPIFGDICLLVTVVFLGIVTIETWISIRHLPITMLTVVIYACMMQWLPGITMFFYAGVIGIKFLALLAKFGNSDPVELPLETPSGPKPMIEYLPDGALIGHKWLVDKGGKLYSPVRPFEWIDGQLTSFNVPLEDNTDGIYVYYSLPLALSSEYGSMANVLVTVACDGEVVYHQAGARVEHAQIIDIVKRTGRW